MESRLQLTDPRSYASWRLETGMECLSPGLGRMGAERSGKPESWAGTQNVVPSPEHRFCLPLHLFTLFNPDTSLVGQAHPQPLFFYTKSHSLVVAQAGLCVSGFWPLHLFRSDRTPCLSSGRVYIKGESLRSSPSRRGGNGAERH